MTYFITIIQRILWTVAGLIVMLAVLSAIILMLQIRIEVNSLKQPLQIAAQQALGRNVIVRGNLNLIPTLWPALEASHVQIANPRGWKKGFFAEINKLQIQLNLLSLLRREFQASEINADGVAINFQNNLYGKSNWYFSAPDSAIKRKRKPADKSQVQHMLHDLDELNLHRVTVDYRDLKMQRTLHWQLDVLEAFLPKHGAFKLQLIGADDVQPYQVNMTAGNVNNFLDQSKAWPVQLNAKFAGTSLSVEGSKTRGRNPELKAKIEIAQINVGAVLDWLEVANNIDATAPSAVADVVFRGHSFSALLERSEFQLTFDDALWTLSDGNTGRKLPIEIKRGELTAKPEAHLALQLDSSIDNIPVAVNIQGGRLFDYARPGAKLPLAITAQGADTQLSMQSSITHPISANNLEFTLRMKGGRLNSLNPLLQLDLPPWGPYSLKGEFSTNPGGYRINDLVMQVGSSNLQGFLNLETKHKRPKLTMQLQSWQLKLGDFALSDWSPTEENDPPQTYTGNLIYEDSFTDVETRFLKLLHPEVLNRLDANIEFKVEQLLSGKDSMGPGSLRLVLEKGKLQLNPLQVDIPGGKFWLHWQFYPTEQDAEFAIQAKVDHVDYGILARHINANSRAAGKLSLDVDLQARTNNVNQFLESSNGRFDFAVWPKNMESRVFDLWPVNMLRAVVTNIDKLGKSKINCAIAGFKLGNGIMKDRLVYVDTTRMMIKGNVKVDFVAETVDAFLQPVSKSPEFFSLETPVKVEGHFKDFGSDINPSHMVGSVISFVSAPLAESNQRTLTDKPMFVHGTEACQEAWQMREIK